MTDTRARTRGYRHSILENGIPVTIHLAELDGLVRCVKLEIGATPQEAEQIAVITTAQVRRVPLGRLVDQALTEYARGLETISGFAPGATSERARAAMPAARASVPRGRGRVSGRRRTLGLELYREVASVYTAAFRLGKPPSKAVADHYSISPSTARKRVMTARRLEFLPQTNERRAFATVDAE